MPQPRIDASSDALLAGRRYAPANLGRVLIIGLGVSGSAVARYCANLLGTRVQQLQVIAGKVAPSEQTVQLASELQAAGASVILDSDQVEGSFDLCIASPGISENAAFYQDAQAASSCLISEVEFAWRESRSDSKWVAITGTNGKTTTTALTAHLAVDGGLHVLAVGNIGDTCIQAVADDTFDVYVAEVSSYQLASVDLFAPDIAVVLNVTPDHLKWHGSLQAYAQAKHKVLAHLPQSGGCAVLCAEDDTVRSWLRELRAKPEGATMVPVGTSAGIQGDMRVACGSTNAAFLREEDNTLVVALDGVEHALCRAEDLAIRGAHNVTNALVAASCALQLGCAPNDVAASLCSFKPLAHRIEPVGEVAGVACYNDSKATNIDATLKALSAFPDTPTIIMLGGDDKGTDLAELVSQVQARCKAAICFGEAGPRFAEALGSDGIPISLEPYMEPALDHALSLAESGDAVLLSPACASFDEFKSFEHRGDVFRNLVAQRAAAIDARSSASTTPVSDEAAPASPATPKGHA